MKSIHGQVHRRPITMLSSDSGKCGTVWGLCLSLGCTLPWPLFPSHFSVVVCSFFSSSFCLPLPSLHFFVLPLLPSSPRRHHFFFFISSASFVRFLFDEFLVFTKFHVVVMQFLCHLSLHWTQKRWKQKEHIKKRIPIVNIFWILVSKFWLYGWTSWN